MARRLLTLLVAAAPAFAQTVQDVLPRGLLLDAAGKLQWLEAEPLACAKCVGTKSVACPRCAAEPAPCGGCSERKVPCPDCGGRGVSLDPFVEVVCTMCSGSRADDCPTCDGKRRLITPAGVEKACGGCAGKGSFACPLCAGKGTLASLRPGGKDLRTASAEQLAAWTKRLLALSEQLEEHRPDKHGFRFDAEGWLLLDAKTLAKENNDYAELWPTLEYLAECSQAAGGPADTLRYATMGVAIGQQLNRCKGYYGATEVEAGDVDCRLIRARVFLDRFQWDAAEKELLLARALTERSGYTGWKQKLESLEVELRAGRRK